VSHFPFGTDYDPPQRRPPSTLDVGSRGDRARAWLAALALVAVGVCCGSLLLLCTVLNLLPDRVVSPR